MTPDLVSKWLQHLVFPLRLKFWFALFLARCLVKHIGSLLQYATVMFCVFSLLGVAGVVCTTDDAVAGTRHPLHSAGEAIASCTVSSWLFI